MNQLTFACMSSGLLKPCAAVSAHDGHWDTQPLLALAYLMPAKAKHFRTTFLK